MKQTTVQTSMALIFGLCAMTTQAATLNTLDRLTINPGVINLDANGNPVSVTISWFGMDADANGKISGSEKTPLSQGTDGIIIGVAQPVGSIDAPWPYNGGIGGHYTTKGISGGTTTGLDMSGWNVLFNGITTSLGSGTWGAGFTNSTASFVWDGQYGHAYTLDYHATAPFNDPSTFGGVRYALHLEGTVQTVPIPAAAWLLGSGLLGLIGVARHKAT